MNAELAIQYLLCNNATFRAHVGTTAANARVYYDVAPQGAQFPYSVVMEVSVEANDTTSAKSNFDFGYVDIDHFASSRTKVADMARDARLALDRATAGTYNTVVIAGVSFQNQRSNVEKIEDGLLHVKQQTYKAIVRV